MACWRRILVAVALGALVTACAPGTEVAEDDGGGGLLVPERIGDGPDTTPAAPATSTTSTTAPPIAGTLPSPTAPDVTARPPVGLGDLPSQVGADLTDARVFVLGDSVLGEVAAAGQLDAVLGPLGWQLTVDALPRTSTEAVGVLQNRLPEIGQVAVIQVGHDQGAAGLEADLQTMLSVLAGTSKVVLLTVSANDPDGRLTNAIIKLVAEREPSRVALVDWDRVSSAADGVLVDGQLTPLGAEVLARTIGTVLGPAPG